jgi:hypothetical protein
VAATGRNQSDAWVGDHQAEDGSETRIGPGDGYVIQPGHDAWVVGDEPWVTVDFSQAMADYAKPS